MAAGSAIPGILAETQEILRHPRVKQDKTDYHITG
jgi:hypothetical protein